MDAEGACASVTCSNGSCSGVVVPGTGVHLNNMLGEQDLNPLGFHQHPPGARVPSMMAPTVVLRDGRPEIAIGSAGSNRIRSAILQTVLGVIDDGLPAQEAVSAPRIHVEGRQVDAEPGVDEGALERLEQAGWPVRRWSELNLFFGGVQAVARDSRYGAAHRGRRPAQGRCGHRGRVARNCVGFRNFARASAGVGSSSSPNQGVHMSTALPVSAPRTKTSRRIPVLAAASALVAAASISVTLAVTATAATPPRSRPAGAGQRRPRPRHPVPERRRAREPQRPGRRAGRRALPPLPLSPSRGRGRARNGPPPRPRRAGEPARPHL